MKNGRRLRFESLECRWLLTADLAGATDGKDLAEMVSGHENLDSAGPSAAFSDVSPWQNSQNRFDVNDDGFVTSMDALVAINDINQNTARPLPTADGEGVSPAFLVDVNGDRFISPADVLAVINYLNADPLDVDQSGSVDVADARAILNYLQNQDSLVFSEPAGEIFGELSRMDTNRDGRVTSADVLLVINAINRATSNIGGEAEEQVLRDANDQRESILADETMDSTILEDAIARLSSRFFI